MKKLKRKWFYIITIPYGFMISYVVTTFVTDSLGAFWIGIFTATMIIILSVITE